MPVELKVKQFDRGTLVSEFSATASSTKLESVAKALSGVSMLIRSGNLKNIGSEPVQIHDKQGRLLFEITIGRVWFS